MAKNAELSNENADSGSPPEVSKFARFVMGDIDLDPASSMYWNHTFVKAKKFYSKEDDGLTQPWFGRVFLNPPGTTDEDRGKRSIPKLFWERAIEHYRDGKITCMFWIGFNTSQVQILQMSPTHPLQFPTNFPAARLDYYERPWEMRDDPSGKRHKNHTNGCEGEGPCPAKCRFGKTKQIKVTLSGPPQRQGAPPRPSYITFVMPRDPQLARPMLERFVIGSDDLTMVPGAIVRPIMRKG